MKLFFSQLNLKDLIEAYKQRYTGISEGFYVKSIEEFLRADDRSIDYLSHLDLTSIDLRDVNLSGYTFYKCKFLDANFTKTKLAGAKFIDCDFTAARIGYITANARCPVSRL